MTHPLISTRHRKVCVYPPILAMANATEQTKESVGNQVRQLLDRLTFWKEENIAEKEDILREATDRPGGFKTWLKIFQRADKAVPKKLGDTREKVSRTMETGVNRWLKFWKRHEKGIKETQKNLEGIGTAVTEGDVSSIKEKVRSVNLGWLTRELRSVEGEAVALSRYVVDHFFPWDYDRKQFGVTFWHIWKDIDANLTGDVNNIVKMTSTIKPVAKEWKLTARTRLLPLGERGIIFGKAGLYILGEQAPYYGVEADKVWFLPRLENTALFANANFRSSRKPEYEAVIASAGVQHTIRIRNDLDFTFRVGFNTQRKFYFTPVPFGQYF